MVRSKIRYELIADERTRRETFKKRRIGLFKKLNELKTLCNVETCAVISNGDRTGCEVWPSLPATTQVVQKFMNLPSSSRTNYMVDQDGFLRQYLSRISKNFEKEDKKVQSLERELLLAECLTKEEANISSSNGSRDILRLLDRKIGMVDRKIANVESSSSRAARVKGRNNEPYHGKGKQPL